MRHFIGVDEAGLGPHLGPLVVAATRWSVEDESRCAAVADGYGLTDLYALLNGTVSRDPRDELSVTICDSKQLYRPGNGLARLEHNVLSCSQSAGMRPTTFRRLLSEVDDAATTCRAELPWYRDYDCCLPVATLTERIEQSGRQLRSDLQAAGVQLHSMRCVVVHPHRLNNLTREFGTKGAALTHVTLQLVRQLTDATVDGHPVTIVCDKHGGRNRYAAQIQHHFHEHLVHVHFESRAASYYSTGEGTSRKSICFRARGEEFLPAALASMLAKYVRELCMRAWNDFWRSLQPGLKPTAGYPQDARRFKAEIADTQRRLAIDDHWLWRQR